MAPREARVAPHGPAPGRPAREWLGTPLIFFRARAMISCDVFDEGNGFRYHSRPLNQNDAKNLAHY